MTPSNPDNQQPLIFRICDALGVFHIVAPVNHTHAQSEIDGLQAALLSKADASSTDTKINGKIGRVPTATNGNIAEFDDDGNIKDSGKKTSDFMLAMTVDSTPTSGSNNLVTSGGVAEAIENAIAIRYTAAQASAKPLIEDLFMDAELKNIDVGIINSTGADASITDLFHISAGQTLLLPDNAPAIPNGKMVLLHIYRTTTQGYFMVSIGGIYTLE